MDSSVSKLTVRRRVLPPIAIFAALQSEQLVGPWIGECQIDELRRSQG
jgi:hypothetical protein